MKAITALIVFILLSIFAVNPAWAVTVNITSYPSEIGSDAFPLTVSIFGASSGTNFIKVNFYKEGSSNYFGETFNNNDWYSGSDGKQYFPITVIDSKSTASASLQARIGSPNNTDYTGPGTYKMRVRRYTASGGQGGEDANLSAVSLTINIPTNTPTPTLSPTPNPTNTPTNKPSSTPTPSPKLTITPTRNLSETPTPTSSEEKTEVLGTETGVEKPKEKDEIKIASLSENNMLPKIFIILGIIFIMLCAIVTFYPFIKNFRKGKINE